MELTVAAQPSKPNIQPTLGYWYYFYFTPPALLVGRSGLSR
jgi:hypothetical protein